ncbi:enoyl-CoA hydratase [soil metagenome]
MQASSTVLLTIDGPIATVTLNRPEAMNALSREFSARLEEVFAELQAMPDVKVAILTGAGRAFCAGMDLKELASGAATLQAADEEQGACHSKFGMGVFDRPLIGAINGVAATGGLELAMHCDMRIASTTARFGDTHARVGVIPGGSMSALLSRLVGLGRAKEMSLTGKLIDAATADRWGLVNRVVEPEELMPAAVALAQEIAAIDGDMLRAYNRLIDENFGMAYADALDNEHVRSRDANQRFERGRVDVATLTRPR